MARGARFSQKRLHPSRKSPLLILPAELRTRIYNLVVTDSTAIRLPIEKLFKAAAKMERKKITYTGPETVLGLARTCKQLHDEVLPVYYGNNTFEFTDTYDLYRYLHMIGPERRAMLQQMAFGYRGDCRREAFFLLGECVSLRTLDIKVSWESVKGSVWPQDDLSDARAFRHLRDAMVKLSNLTVNVEEMWDAFFVRTMGEGGLQKFVPEKDRIRNFEPENVLMVQDMLRSDVARKA